MTERLPHGGNLTKAEAEYGRPLNGWLDLSTGINPMPYPVGRIDPKFWHRLPDQADLHVLLLAARQAYGIAGQAGVVAAPGTQAIIQALPGLFAKCTVAVVGPTYAEHELCWRAAGHETRICHTLTAATGSDIAVVVNPNNPDGREIPGPEIVAAARHMAAKGGLLVVDEAFADCRPEIGVCGQSAITGMIVLRSFGKFYGLAGARLGFAVGDRDVTIRLETALGPWAVPGPTLAIATQALGDDQWRTKTLRRLLKDTAALDGVLSQCGLSIIGGTPLFRLCETVNGADLYGGLAAQGILVRIFSERPQWVRFGLPANGDDLARLRDSLENLATNSTS